MGKTTEIEQKYSEFLYNLKELTGISYYKDDFHLILEGLKEWGNKKLEQGAIEAKRAVGSELRTALGMIEIPRHMTDMFNLNEPLEGSDPLPIVRGLKSTVVALERENQWLRSIVERVMKIEDPAYPAESK